MPSNVTVMSEQIEPLVRKTLHVRNTGDSLVVTWLAPWADRLGNAPTLRVCQTDTELGILWLEPWADRFELTRDDLVEIVFVGPDTGVPGIAVKQEELSIYPWGNAEVVVFKNGRIAGDRPTVQEIIRQEYEIAGERLPQSFEENVFADVAAFQEWLDMADLNSLNQLTARNIISELIDRVVANLEMTDQTAKLLWQIAARTLRTQGVILITPRSYPDKQIFRGKAIESFLQAMFDSAEFILPGESFSQRNSNPPAKRVAKLRRDE